MIGGLESAAERGPVKLTVGPNPNSRGQADKDRAEHTYDTLDCLCRSCTNARLLKAEGAPAINRIPADKPGPGPQYADFVGIGGAPTRATTLPTGAEERKKYPVASGALDYFPDAIAAISNLSWKGNEQHNPGQPLHWARSKSTDEADTMLRHFLQRGTLDTDGIRHTVKMAWRALALLQKELEKLT